MLLYFVAGDPTECQNRVPPCNGFCNGATADDCACPAGKELDDDGFTCNGMTR